MSMSARAVLPTVALWISCATSARAEIGVPSIFGENMVLQQKQENKVWGWGEAGESVTVTLAGQSAQTVVDAEGKWELKLKPMAAGGPHRLSIAGKNKLSFDNVMIGEVWICSGQSNMAWPVTRSNDPQLEIKTANYPNIRLISVPQVSAESPQRDFNGEWKVCTPQTVADFSAVGYFFGRQLHQTLNVPIGLVDNAWGGSACEAWVNRDVLESDQRFEGLMDHWEGVEAYFRSGEAKRDHEKRLEEWEVKAAAAEKDGKPVPRKPRLNMGSMTGNQRPANLYNGVLHPTIGYGIRGAIWYQGESNASRAYQYRDLFPVMIKNWREEWGEGDFPFYWVQLADFRTEKAEPAESDWAELREAQTMTMDKLPHAGEAVIIDLGEANDIHPTNKQDVAKRLSRWALARDYGHTDLAYRSPRYQSVKAEDGHLVVTFDHVGSGLDTLDVNEPLGFTVAGKDKVFHRAKAEILGRRGSARNQIKVWSDSVSSPVAVRYAWADNPVCNVRSFDGLPLTPFRSDDWPGVTVGRESR